MSQLPPERSRNYRLIGLAGTASYAALLAAYVTTQWSQFSALSPNEVGDFVAGVLGPLAIYWLVLGFWQQGDELRSSVHALNLQSEELRNSVEQQKALVEVTRTQAQAELEALKEERHARKLALSPRIMLRSQGGMSTGGEITSRFVLYNIGADCSDVKLNVTGQFVNRSYEYPVLKNGDSQRLELQYNIKDMSPLLVTVAYRLMDGTLGSCEFSATPHESNRFSFVVRESVSDDIA